MAGSVLLKVVIAEEQAKAATARRLVEVELAQQEVGFKHFLPRIYQSPYR
jgi:hypothetical protein